MLWYEVAVGLALVILSFLVWKYQDRIGMVVVITMVTAVGWACALLNYGYTWFPWEFRHNDWPWPPGVLRILAYGLLSLFFMLRLVWRSGDLVAKGR